MSEANEPGGAAVGLSLSTEMLCGRLTYTALMRMASDAGLGPANVSGMLQARLELFGRAVEKATQEAERKHWELADEGAKEAFGHVVQQKRDLEAKLAKTQALLDSAYADIRRLTLTHNA